MLKIFKERTVADIITILGIIPLCFAFYFTLIYKPELAMLSAILAFVCDSLDGVIARHYRTDSEYGRQLDSFMDCLIYLIFPSLFILQFHNHITILTILVSSMVISFGILRLVRFNTVGFIYKDGHKGYPGLGTAYMLPIVACIDIASKLINESLSWAYYPILIIVSFFMISEIPIKKPRLYVWYPITLVYILTYVYLYLK